MNDHSSTSTDSTEHSTPTTSGEKIGLHQPSDDKRINDKLENVDLTLRGSKVHDHLRDKRSDGVPGEYDDSIEHDAESRYVEDNAPKRPKE